MLRRTASRSAVTSWPATHADPEVGRASVHSILIVVDLPAPLGPRKPNVSPTGTSKSMPRTALISPKFLVRPATVIAGRWCPFAAWAAGPDIPCTATLPCLLGVQWRAYSLPAARPLSWASRRAARPSLLAGVVIGREDRVELAAGVGEDLLRLRHLGGRADLGDLHGRGRHRGDQPAQFDRVGAHAAGDVVPGGPDLVGVRLDVLAPLGGQRIALAPALGRLRLDQALVLQLLQRRVHRPGAGLPDAVAALRDLLDQLVAVPGLLGEQRQGGGPYVTAPDPRATAEPALAGPWAERVRHRAEPWRAERTAPPPGATRPPANPGTPAAPPAFLGAPLVVPVLVMLVMSTLVMFVHLRMLLLSSNPTVREATFLPRHLDDISITVGTQELFRPARWPGRGAGPTKHARAGGCATQGACRGRPGWRRPDAARCGRA